MSLPEFVARAAPDGYTLYLSTRSNTVHKTMYATSQVRHGQRPASDRAACHGAQRYRDGFTRTDRTHPRRSRASATYPGAVTCASSGVGSTGHLLCELFQRETKTTMPHVAYRGSAQLPGRSGRRSGRPAVAVLPAALPRIQAGGVRPVAVMSRQRASTDSAGPSSGRNRHPRFESGYLVWANGAGWNTATRREERRNDSINTILVNPAANGVYGTGYLALRPNTPETFGRLISRRSSGGRQ